MQKKQKINPKFVVERNQVVTDFSLKWRITMEDIENKIHILTQIVSWLYESFYLWFLVGSGEHGWM